MPTQIQPMKAASLGVGNGQEENVARAATIHRAALIMRSRVVGPFLIVISAQAGEIASPYSCDQWRRKRCQGGWCTYKAEAAVGMGGASRRLVSMDLREGEWHCAATAHAAERRSGRWDPHALRVELDPSFSSRPAVRSNH